MVTVPAQGTLLAPKLPSPPIKRGQPVPPHAIRQSAYKGSPFSTEPPCTSVFPAQAFPPLVPLPIPSSLALLQLFPRKAETKDALAVLQGDPHEASLFLGFTPSPRGAVRVMRGAAPLLGWAKAMGIARQAGSSRPTHQAIWRKIFHAKV